KSKDREIEKEKSRANSAVKEKTSLASELKTAKANANSANDKLKEEQTASKKLTDELARWKDRAENSERLLASLPKSAGNSSAETNLIVGANTFVTSLQQRLEGLDRSDREAAMKLLQEACKSWAETEPQLTSLKNERVELLKTVAEGGEDVLKIDERIRAVTEALSQKEKGVRQALAKLDAADRVHFDELESGIKKLEGLVTEWTDPKGKRKLLTVNPEVVKLKEQIATLKRQQMPYSNGKQRAAGLGNELTVTEIMAISNVERSVSSVDTARLKPGDLRIIKIQGIETRWRWIPAGSFKMGSPANEKDRSNDEDQVDVTISRGFWMFETEVTQEFWQKVMGT
ncbi:MAG: hypothetical protein FJ267_20025, partial [Planctomycetes bacterium]|nr:hypothetical protein [Planctomycetota bacterium]